MRHSISDTSALILDRRSISPERFSGRKVHREIVEQVLLHATWAPNHGLTQPWRFQVFMDASATRLMGALSEAYRLNAGDKAMASKAEKIKARGERCNAIVALGLAHDPPTAGFPCGKIKQPWRLASKTCTSCVRRMALVAIGPRQGFCLIRRPSPHWATQRVSKAWACFIWAIPKENGRPRAIGSPWNMSRIGTPIEMRWTNWYTHPADNRYHVFEFRDFDMAAEFEAGLKAEGIESEKGERESKTSK